MFVCSISNCQTLSTLTKFEWSNKLVKWILMGWSILWLPSRYLSTFGTSKVDLAGMAFQHLTETPRLNMCTWVFAHDQSVAISLPCNLCAPFAIVPLRIALPWALDKDATGSSFFCLYAMSCSHQWDQWDLLSAKPCQRQLDPGMKCTVPKVPWRHRGDLTSLTLDLSLPKNCGKMKGS